jgi:heme-degrading monooxygenase HmoA
MANKGIKRIVKMTFRPEETESFIQDIFDTTKSAIRSFPGCKSVELLRDISQPNVLFTFSIWESPDALEAYRNSELFQNTWAKTKVKFADKAQAWSMEAV